MKKFSQHIVRAAAIILKTVEGHDHQNPVFYHTHDISFHKTKIIKSGKTAPQSSTVHQNNKFRREYAPNRKVRVCMEL